MVSVGSGMLLRSAALRIGFRRPECLPGIVDDSTACGAGDYEAKGSKDLHPELSLADSAAHQLRDRRHYHDADPDPDRRAGRDFLALISGATMAR
jgi:hypothetical protein